MKAVWPKAGQEAWRSNAWRGKLGALCCEAMGLLFLYLSPSEELPIIVGIISPNRGGVGIP